MKILIIGGGGRREGDTARALSTLIKRGQAMAPLPRPQHGPRAEHTGQTAGAGISGPGPSAGDGDDLTGGADALSCQGCGACLDPGEWRACAGPRIAAFFFRQRRGAWRNRDVAGEAGHPVRLCHRER